MRHLVEQLALTNPFYHLILHGLKERIIGADHANILIQAANDPMVRCPSPERCPVDCMAKKSILLAVDERQRSLIILDNHTHRVYNRGMNSKDIIKQIEDDGWYLVRVRGSHHHFKHATKPGLVTVPHPKRDLPKGTVNSILRQAGLR